MIFGKLGGFLMIAIKDVAGFLFIIIGIIGLFLPFIQGMLFIALGLTFLHSTRLYNVVNIVKQKFFDWWRNS